MAFMQARCYTNAPIQHLLLCALDRPLLMCPTHGCRCTARRKLSRARKVWASLHFESTENNSFGQNCSFCSNGWVGLLRKKTVLGYFWAAQVNMETECRIGKQRGS